ncbi:MAG TPA: NepR family anti-sigma factor [Hyphomicrobium sp.]
MEVPKRNEISFLTFGLKTLRHEASFQTLSPAGPTVKIRQDQAFTMQHRVDGVDEHSRKNGELPEVEPHPESEAARPGVARLPGIATQLIGERMRTMYASMMREPVPDALLELIRQLESKEGSE